VNAITIGLDSEISELDLEPIMVKCMDDEEGYGWSLELTKSVEKEYKRFLTLCKENPEFPMVPSNYVDDFWHLHILDTQKYKQDCDTALGYFLHHFPYFGMRGSDDLDNLDKAWSESIELYKKRFGHINDEIWSASRRCPNCGRRIDGNGYFNDERPRLKVVC
jgi:Uncharacterized conserved protein